MNNDNLTRWHKIVQDRDWPALNEMLDENVEFHSPFVWSPKRGRQVTAFILKNVVEVLADFAYHREWVDSDSMALEFSAKIGELSVKGIDLIRFNENNKIVHFEVMLRPANALMKVGEAMSARIEKAGH